MIFEKKSSEIKSAGDIHEWITNVRGETKRNMLDNIKLFMDANSLYSVMIRCPDELTLQIIKENEMYSLGIKEGEDAKDYITAFNYGKLLNDKIIEHPFFFEQVLLFTEQYKTIKGRKKREKFMTEFIMDIPDMQSLCCEQINMLDYVSMEDFETTERIMNSGDYSDSDSD